MGIATSAVFSQVYPVTRADYKNPHRCDLKGQSLKSCCDAHFVLVRRVCEFKDGKLVLNNDEPNWVYQARNPGESPSVGSGTELVISQEHSFYPEFAIEVELLNSPVVQKQVRAV